MSESFSWQSLLGESLLKKNADGVVETVPVSVFENCKRVGLYFSAHWCPPCTSFTPKLVKFYNAVKADDFQIIFISCDKNINQFNAFFNEMPFTALPCAGQKEKREQKKTRAKLGGKFKVHGIPKLIILNEKGEETKGKHMATVNEWYTGDQPKIINIESYFPNFSGDKWLDLLGDRKLTVKNGHETSEVSAVEHVKKFKRIVFYYAAKWHPTCKELTPKLIKFYNAMKAAYPNDLEIIYTTSDPNEEDYISTYATQPWASFGFADHVELEDAFGVREMPHLQTFDQSGSGVIGNLQSAVRNLIESTERTVQPIETYLRSTSGSFYEDNFQGLINSENETIEDSPNYVKTFDYLMVYCSAHWSPPCHEFTPKLVKFYNTYRDLKAESLEIVFVSADRRQKEFDSYFAEMPWLSTGFGETRLLQELDCQELPSVYVFNKSGENFGTFNAQSIVENAVKNHEAFDELATLFV